jgi:hypothetical protein
VAGLWSSGSDVLKWKSLAESVQHGKKSETLFFAKNGHPLPALVKEEPHFARYGYKRGPIRSRNQSQAFRATERLTFSQLVETHFDSYVRAYEERFEAQSGPLRPVGQCVRITAPGSLCAAGRDSAGGSEADRRWN